MMQSEAFKHWVWETAVYFVVGYFVQCMLEKLNVAANKRFVQKGLQA